MGGGSLWHPSFAVWILCLPGLGHVFKAKPFSRVRQRLPPTQGPSNSQAPPPQVSGTTQRMKVDLEQHLARLSEIFAARGDYLQTLKFIQQMAGSILVQMAGVPAWREVTMQLTELADQTGYVEYYR